MPATVTVIPRPNRRATARRCLKGMRNYNLLGVVAWHGIVYTHTIDQRHWGEGSHEIGYASYDAAYKGCNTFVQAEGSRYTPECPVCSYRHAEEDGDEWK
jgi:hypothetical protein